MYQSQQNPIKNGMEHMDDGNDLVLDCFENLTVNGLDTWILKRLRFCLDLHLQNPVCAKTGIRFAIQSLSSNLILLQTNQ
jgi:hypothetical protein